MIGDLLSAPPACINEPGTWCFEVYSVTHNTWLAESANWLIAKPLKILFILALALAVRFIAHRVIDRLTRNRGRPATIIAPLREQVPNTLAPLMSQRRVQRTRTIGTVLKSIVSLIVWGLAVVLILGELGVNLTPIIASAGVIGLAVGFGAQNLVKDFLSGVFMLLEDQYGVGDVVDLGEAKGTVESVGLRITTVRDGAGTVWYMRNGEVERVGNKSQGFAVAVVDIPLGYNANLAQALGVLEQTATEATGQPPLNEDVLEPPKVLGIQDMTTDSLTLRLTVKVRPARQWAAQRELRRQIMAAFEQAGIEPPITNNN